MNKIVIALLFFVLSFSYGISRTSRIGQIPNGSVYKCSNCHIKTAGGGALTSFGTQIKDSYLKNNNVDWGAALAALDADGDGYSNGVELQDPAGEWKMGDPACGDTNFVSKPGDATSIPKTSSVEDFELKSGFILNSIAANPVSINSKVKFTLKNPGYLLMNVIDINGKECDLLTDMFLAAGEYSIPLNIKNIQNSGNYFIRINFNGYNHIEKINLIK